MKSKSQEYFETFRKNIIGVDYWYTSPSGGRVKMIYADWIAGGRLYRPIEERMVQELGPFVANTHTETSETGTLMTYAYHHAHQRLKEHVNAGPEDVIITCGSGMTGVINKFQRILGLKLCGVEKSCYQKELRRSRSNNQPVVFVTHMEHHSNHTSWLETVAEVVVVPPGDDLTVDPENLRRELEKYKDRRVKIGSFSACSNVTGVRVPVHRLAALMHEYGGVCFADYAAAAPYEDIDMHPSDEGEHLDAVFFSPHKFLGGPGSSGVLVFNRSLYSRSVPDHPGGGTVRWTNPWGEHSYFDEIELREDGGTPAFLQTIKAAMAVELKEKMGTGAMREREKDLVTRTFEALQKMPALKILASRSRDRIGCVSFCSEHIHYNLVVKLLSDRYGIQVRGGCTCAGTYGHLLLHVDRQTSRRIADRINRGDLSAKPGWVRLSLHPTLRDEELTAILAALGEIMENAGEWEKDYRYDPKTNEFYHRNPAVRKEDVCREWFRL